MTVESDRNIAAPSTEPTVSKAVQDMPRLVIRGLLWITLAATVWLGIDRPRLTSQIEMYKEEIRHKTAMWADERIAHEARVRELEQTIARLEMDRRLTEDEFKKQLETIRLAPR